MFRGAEAAGRARPEVASVIGASRHEALSSRGGSGTVLAVDSVWSREGN